MLEILPRAARRWILMVVVVVLVGRCNFGGNWFVCTTRSSRSSSRYLMYMWLCMRDSDTC